jgi:hypothetical protein
MIFVRRFVRTLRPAACRLDEDCTGGGPFISGSIVAQLLITGTWWTSILALVPFDREPALYLLQSPLFNLASDLFCPRLIKYLLCDREQFLFLVAHMFADKVP